MSSRSDSDDIDRSTKLEISLLDSNTSSGSPAPQLSLSTCTSSDPALPSSNAPPDPSFSLPITPEALLKHVRHMRIAAKLSKIPSSHPSPDLSTSTSVHSRTASSASSTGDDVLAPYSSNSTPHNSSAELPSNNDLPPPSNHSLPIPDLRPDDPRAIAETLDLSHQRIADLTQPVVEELAEYVERLALGYNYLPVLPDHFAILGSSLRYLNLRGNHMEIFPEVLTRMPSLEILDVSRNKIKGFPRRPGSLDRLRVLSVSRNRIRRLPNYVANLTTLRVLKLDHNPVVWPPRELVTFIDAAADKVDEDDLDHPQRLRQDRSAHHRTRTPSNETNSAMAQWLRTLQDWMRRNPYVRPLKQIRPSTGETLADPSDIGLHCQIHLKRSSSMTRTSISPQVSPLISLESIQSPPAIIQPLQQDKPVDHLLQHNRNASSSSSTQWVRKRPELRLKKSLPDLRRNHAEIMVERSADAERSFFGLSHLHHLAPPNSGSALTFSINSPPPDSQQPRLTLPLSAGAVQSPVLTNGPLKSSAGSVTFKELELPRLQRSQDRRLKIGNGASEERLAGDRNSGAYFRRLSMLPASTISKQVPMPLLELMDGIRGILFSLSQIYAALKQFVVFATQDRLPGALSRMTSAADDSMGRLINALDRFDSSTRRSQPEMEVVEEVFKSCRENVVVFGKLVHVLSIQLKVLTGSADVRYSRTLLLSLYGATAEIAMSWSMITPLVDDVISLPRLTRSRPTQLELRDDPVRRLPPHRELATPQLRMTNSPETTRAELDSSSELMSESMDALKTLPSQWPNVLSPTLASSTSNRQKGRRHAGSFSVEDVQLGAILPPASAGLVSSFPNGPPTPIPSNSPAGLSPIAPSDASLLPRSEPSGRLAEAPMHHGSRPIATRSGSIRPSDAGSVGLVLPQLTIGQRADREIDSPMPVSPVNGLLRGQQGFSSMIGLGSPPGNTGQGEGPSELTVQSGDSLTIATERPTTTTTMSERTSSLQGGRGLRSETSGTQAGLSSCSPSAMMARNGAGYSTPPTTSGHHATEQTSSRRQHARIDSTLGRTDQDFLDMTEATIEIAVSVTSMMVENLGQAVVESRAQEASGGGGVKRSTRGVELGGESGVVGKLSKAVELKELCEIEIEVIKRLRASLAGFWASRLSCGREGGGNGGGGGGFGGIEQLVEGGQGVSAGGGASGGTCGGGEDREGVVHGPEAKRVFEDATAFVRAVIQTANLARATMTEYPLTKGIREGLGQLTKATKELATLLAVSSFKPGSTAVGGLGGSSHLTGSGAGAGAGGVLGSSSILSGTVVSNGHGQEIE